MEIGQFWPKQLFRAQFMAETHTKKLCYGIGSHFNKIDYKVTAENDRQEAKTKNLLYNFGMWVNNNSIFVSVI